jgi:hypothetical protein
MTLIVRPGFMFDADASTYIEAVEVADTQALETATRYAINDFVIGCKQDGIWSAIKASCILAGARTLAGALVPLVGAAPTNVNFVSGDYDRKTGLLTNGTTKYLNSNRNNDLDPQNSRHLAVYTTNNTIGVIGGRGVSATNGRSYIIGNQSALSSTGTPVPPYPNSNAGFRGISRNLSTAFTIYSLGTTTSFAIASQAPASFNYYVFAYNDNGSLFYTGLPRMPFYSIGESLNLALLDARVTDLITAFGAAIP